MKKVKTGELTGKALDFAVAIADGYLYGATCHVFKGMVLDYGGNQFIPSDDWGVGGPIIERERISVSLCFRGSYGEGANAEPTCWAAKKYKHGVLNETEYEGATPLIAAMRCFVASKLGDEVDVPDELVEATIKSV